MHELDTSASELPRLIESRVAVMRTLAESLELSTSALLQNDAETIARGAAHQAELCRQWSSLESRLQLQANNHALRLVHPARESPAGERFPRLQQEWEALHARIRYLSRVHFSLLRHLQRSLSVLQRVVDGCASTYTPGRACLSPDVETGAPPQVRSQVRPEVRSEVWPEECSDDRPQLHSRKGE